MKKTKDLVRGDVVLIDFPFIEKPELTKLRPAVMISRSVFGGKGIFMFITSITRSRTHSIRVEGELMKSMGLKKQSQILCSKIATIESGSLHRYIGSSSERVMVKIDAWIKNNIL